MDKHGMWHPIPWGAIKFFAHKINTTHQGENLWRLGFQEGGTSYLAQLAKSQPNLVLDVCHRSQYG